jgi:hypothetical protein
MTKGDLAFATACVRGVHTALAAFKQWARQQELTQHDETFIHALDSAALASKDWLRSKVKELAPHEDPQQ